MTDGVVLVVRRTIRATPERLFEAWTRAELLRAWWGPRGVSCSDASIDLRIGGRYRIDNAMPDGRTVIIDGEFLEIEAPRRLVYSWRIDDGENAPPSRVTVRFEAQREGTDVVVFHEKLPNQRARDAHEEGWNGCIDGLATFVDERRERA
jgi:uncharacterized protein YndB with AHSA1/START domain